MIYLLGGYMWLYVHRPFEVWPALGAIQLERGYMLLMLLAWAVNPYKTLAWNRNVLGVAAFSVALLGAWLTSPYAATKGSLDAMETYFKVLVFFVIVVTSVRTEKDLRLLVLMFLAANALYMAHSLREWFAGRYESRMGVSRMIGIDMTWRDPNAFASTLLFTLPLLVPFWLEQPRRIPRWLIVAYALACCFCISRTASRAGFVGLVALIGLLYVGGSRRKLGALVTCAVAGTALLGLALMFGPEDLVTRYMTLIDENVGQRNAHESAAGRMIGFQEGIRVWLESPLFGHGPATFAISTERGGQAHNLIGQVLSETGLAGALGLLTLIVCFFLNWAEARRLVRAEGMGPPGDFSYQVVRALSYTIVLMVLMGWSGHNLFRYNWQWFAAFQAIAMCGIRSRTALARQPSAYAPYRLAWQG
jgi:O-antigen ligase